MCCSLIFIKGLCLFFCGHPCVAAWLELLDVRCHLNSSSFSGCGRVQYFNDFWYLSRFIWAVHEYTKQKTPGLWRLGFVKQMKTTTSIGNDNSAGAPTNVNATKRELPVTDSCFIYSTVVKKNVSNIMLSFFVLVMCYSYKGWVRIKSRNLLCVYTTTFQIKKATLRANFGWTQVFTCKDGFVGLKLLAGHTQGAVREAGVLPQAPQLIC